MRRVIAVGAVPRVYADAAVLADPRVLVDNRPLDYRSFGDPDVGPAYVRFAALSAGLS